MEQMSARAALVPASDLGDGLTTTIPRSDIQAVLAAEEEPIELVLDIARSSDGEAAATRNVSVTWERTDLEQLLEEAQGDQIVLTFDREALARATDDVEAHGFREVALAIAVAATAAGGAAAGAAAEPGAYLGGKAPIEESTSPEIPYLSHGQGVTEADLGIATGTSPDDRAVARSDEAAAPTPASPEIPYLSHGQGVTEADLGIGTGTSPDDRALPRTDPVATTGGTVSDPSTFSVPGPETVGVAAAIALMITGAYFLVGAGRRRVRPI
ncbi:MAG TPA: hypothetical protein VKA24_11085 [Gaiellaceae bacterium]|nr:hypothetical protein [Gaiellaceae bacterium]